MAFGFQGVYCLLLQSTGFVSSGVLDFLKPALLQTDGGVLLSKKCELNFKKDLFVMKSYLCLESEKISCGIHI